MHNSLLSISLVCLFLAACGSDSKTNDGGGGGSGPQAGSGGAGGAGGQGTAGRGGAGGSAGTGGSGADGSVPDAGTDASGGPDVAADGEGSDVAVVDATGDLASLPGGVSPLMSFFVSSKGSGKGGDFGGLEGADAHCKALATAVSPVLGAKTWRAYLSTATVNAATRIGTGPWRNAKGVVVANSLQELHEEQDVNGDLSMTWPVGNTAFAVILDEKGETHENAVHDILTGSTMAGSVDGAYHCDNWTSQTGMGTVGHSNRSGGGRPPSWNAAHQVGCGSELDDQGAPRNRVQGTVTSGGGRGSIYCFDAGP